MQINNNDYKVLEVCCAPGAKLTYISDLMRTYGPGRRLFGIDINENRLNIARSLVNKYGHSAMVTLILGDGTTYQGEHDFDKILVDAECTHEGSIKHL
jgi:16S rRNA C967 or C1407 C5-methylase (RsmB/RsmF family)